MTERTYSDRGFAQHQPIPGGTAYGGTVRVYESSSAAAPRIWMAVESLTGAATIHLSLDAEELPRAQDRLSAESEASQ